MKNYFAVLFPLIFISLILGACTKSIDETTFSEIEEIASKKENPKDSKTISCHYEGKEYILTFSEDRQNVVSNKNLEAFNNATSEKEGLAGFKMPNYSNDRLSKIMYF